MAKTKEKTKAVKERKLPVRIRPRCPDCSFRVRGENHGGGIHHKSGGRGKFPQKRF